MEFYAKTEELLCSCIHFTIEIGSKVDFRLLKFSKLKNIVKFKHFKGAVYASCINLFLLFRFTLRMYLKANVEKQVSPQNSTFQ